MAKRISIAQEHRATARKRRVACRTAKVATAGTASRQALNRWCQGCRQGLRGWLGLGAVLAVLLAPVLNTAFGQQAANQAQSLPVSPSGGSATPVVAPLEGSGTADADPTPGRSLVPQQWLDEAVGPAGLSSSLKVMLLLTLLSLAPAILMMTTSFIRIVVVLALLRQAVGTQQLPPSQVITSLALFLTLLIMAPVWQQVYDTAVAPYSAGQISLDEAWQQGQEPVRRFMADQIERTGNTDDVWLFLDYLAVSDSEADELPNYVYYGADQEQGEANVPLQVLLPAFMLSELKTAFIIGFQIYLPFVILDMVVASVMISMGMLMLPPVLISLPFKLLLFVLVDGWRLVVEMLLQSFEPFG